MKIEKLHTATLTLADLEQLISKETGFKAKIKFISMGESGNRDEGTYKKELVEIGFNLD